MALVNDDAGQALKTMQLGLPHYSTATNKMLIPLNKSNYLSTFLTIIYSPTNKESIDKRRNSGRSFQCKVHVKYVPKATRDTVVNGVAVSATVSTEWTTFSMLILMGFLCIILHCYFLQPAYPSHMSL
ncbi:uncharacterized protein EV154DRAFT_488810 [Mucor mucedo]|uniref:uncharacterized protein n=1 Tax=Mucor mucedo TaxID=29922 RepID=UPI002220F0D0|nr:uncharacterized protein EV154DRAFT_488810 [Mucor mucedo]KAI7864958.1 hypothetical protein EV154DRAFT_488810 [Mucor mucedo]